MAPISTKSGAIVAAWGFLVYATLLAAWAFYLLCRVQRPQRTHKHLAGKCTVRRSVTGVVAPSLSTSWWQYYEICALLTRTLRCQSDSKRGIRKVCSERAQLRLYVPGWRQGSEVRLTTSPLTLWLLFTRWASAQILIVDLKEFFFFLLHFPGSLWPWCGEKKKKNITTSATRSTGAMAAVGAPLNHGFSVFNRALLSSLSLTLPLTITNSQLHAWFPCWPSATQQPRVRGATGEEFTKLARRLCCVIL